MVPLPISRLFCPLTRSLPPAAALCLALVGALPAAAAAPVSLGPAASEPPEIALSFEEAALVVTGLTPGGEAVIFSLARIPLGYTQRVEQRVESIPVDPLGEGYFLLGAGAEVPPNPVWAVVDLVSGGYAVDAPTGFLLQQRPFPGSGFEVGAPGLVQRLRHTFEWVDMVLVRPGLGAWWLRASDGGPGDADGEADGITRTALEDAEPIGASPLAPEVFVAGDVVIVIDPRTLAFYATRLIGRPGEVE